MTILNWALWGLTIASGIAIIVGGGVIAVDKTICGRHDRATALIVIGTVVSAVAGGISVVIA